MALKRVLLVALSDPVRESWRYEAVREGLEKYGIQAEIANSLRQEVSAKEKAEEFNQALRSRRYDWIFDMSGGNLANLVLPYLDYEAYAQSDTWYAAFSDGTCIVNALSTCSKKKAMLFGLWQQSSLESTVRLIQSGRMELGVVPLEGDYFPRNVRLYGGNMRCLLKLAGTGRMPDFHDSYLLLESSSADLYLFESMAAHMAQCQILEGVRGIVLGRFNRLERELGSPEKAWQTMMDILKPYCPDETAFFAAPYLGHLENAQGVWISAGYRTPRKETSPEAGVKENEAEEKEKKSEPDGAPGSGGPSPDPLSMPVDPAVLEQIRAQARKKAAEFPELKKRYTHEK